MVVRLVPKGRTGLKIRVMVNRVKEAEKSSLREKKKNAYQAFGDAGEVINFLILLV